MNKIFSDESQRLMHAHVVLANGTHGVIRGYDPANKKWWVVSTASGWHIESNFKVSE